MCGIAGIVSAHTRDLRRQLDHMVTALQHRGPDGTGTHFFNTCALGHTRLRIIDLKTGDQPMCSTTGSTAIVFNGEIYGYKDIREKLTSYQFQTTSDTEVILALYERYGEHMLAHLPGMFAFAVWDETNQRLFCARDRFGEKPFYYALGKHGEFIFASELKAIIASGLIEPVLDLDMVAYYCKYLFVHPHRTIYKNIHTLAPGHQLIFKAGQVHIQRYWSPPHTTASITLSDAVPRFQQLMQQAVDRQMIADVPVAAFLSGGLDSSTIVALASKAHPKLMTFSFAFGEAINELPFAREVAARYRTDHHELQDDQVDLGKTLEEMQHIYDEPFADSSNIPTYLLAKLTRSHVAVVLSGDGGDELLGGYSYWYRPLVQAQARRVSADALRTLIRYIRSGGQRAVARDHQQQLEYFSTQDLRSIGLSPIGHEWQLKTGTLRYSNSVNDAMQMDIHDYLPGDILVKTDRAAMAHGLELRAPFLDVDLASFCISLPDTLKIDGTRDKILLREAFGSLWPTSVQQRGKQGFGAPVAVWLQTPSIRALIDRYLHQRDRKIYSILSFDAVHDLMQTAGPLQAYRTWIFLVLSLWLEAHEYSIDECDRKEIAL